MLELAASRAVLAVIGLVLVVVLGVLVHARPRWGALAWVLTIALVPVWLGVTVSLYFLPASIVGLFVVASTLPVSPGRLGLGDLLVGFFFLSCLAPVLSGGATLGGSVGVVLLQWMLAFSVGRLLPLRLELNWLFSLIAVVFTLVAALAVAEFFLHWNPFIHLGGPNPLHLRWGTLQGRGGATRAEGAFGHSIALGCSLALAIPLTLATRFRPLLRLAMLCVLLGGVAVTISRISMVCAAVGIVLTVLFLPAGLSKRLRVGISTVLVAAAAALTPTLISIFTKAGAEAANSASYRGSLTELLPHIAILGQSPIAYTGPTGDLYFGRFQSIDSQILFTGLSYGWFALGLALVLLAGAGLLMLRRRATAVTIAIVAQIPALATVALITQYGTFFFFLAGLAVASQLTGIGPVDGAAAPQTSETEVVVAGAAARR